MDEMSTDKMRAERYRREAAACLEVAERMPIASDRARLLEMAQQWLNMAIREETRPHDSNE